MGKQWSRNRNSSRNEAGHQSNDTLQPGRTPSVRHGNRGEQTAMSRAPSMFENVFGDNHFGRDNIFNNGVGNISELSLVYANVANFS